MADPVSHQKATLQGFSVVLTLTLALRYASLLCESKVGIGLPIEVEQVLAPALGIAAMLFFQVKIHPPAAACAIQYMQLRHDNPQTGPTYLLAPVLVGALWMLAVQLAVAKAFRTGQGGKTGEAVAGPMLI